MECHRVCDKELELWGQNSVSECLECVYICVYIYRKVLRQVAGQFVASRTQYHIFVPLVYELCSTCISFQAILSLCLKYSVYSLFFFKDLPE